MTDGIYDVSLEAMVILGTATLPISQLLKLGRGAIIELDRKVNDPVDVVINNKTVAKAEVVVIEHNLGITITEMLK
jgi:flagellar motor switch protein FliN/FliY